MNIFVFIKNTQNETSNFMRKIVAVILQDKQSFHQTCCKFNTLFCRIELWCIKTIIIIIRKGRQCKAGRERLTPYQSEDPNPTTPTHRMKDDIICSGNWCSWATTEHRSFQELMLMSNESIASFQELMLMSNDRASLFPGTDAHEQRQSLASSGDA